MGRRGSENKVYSLRIPIWMAEVIDKLSKEKRCTSSDIIVELLRQEMEVMGYSMGIGRQAVSGQAEPQAADVLPKVKKAV